MTEGTAANMSQRSIMQYLSLHEWKLVSGLPVAVGPVMLDRMQRLGWIELRAKPRTEIRLTQSGLDAMKAVV